MIKRLAAIFVLFCGVVLIVFLFNAIVGLAPSASGQEDPGPLGSGDAGGGLQIINFADFAKGGAGWQYITQGYGVTPYAYLYIHHWHPGIDIGAPFGAPVYSADTGTVLATGNQDAYCPGKAFGKFVVVSDAAQDLEIVYAHMGAIDVAPGDAVTQDKSLIGTLGPTGLETGPHLLFMVFERQGFTMTPAYGCGPYPQGHDIDPVPYLEAQ